MSVELREGDVVRYEPRQTHCHDGQAVARVRHNGLVLVDTYWLSDGTVVNPSTFEVKFNLNDYERVPSHAWERFAVADRQVLHRQHGCTRDYLVRKGAVESREQVIANAREALAAAEADVKRAVEVEAGRARLLAHLLAGGTS